MNDKDGQRSNETRWIRRLAGYCWRYRRDVVITLAGSLLTVAATLVIPLLQRRGLFRTAYEGTLAWTKHKLPWEEFKKKKHIIYDCPTWEEWTEIKKPFARQRSVCTTSSTRSAWPAACSPRLSGSGQWNCPITSRPPVRLFSGTVTRYASAGSIASARAG